MKRSYIVQEPKRLDQIVWEVYGNLEQFEEVLEANPKLSKKMILQVGDVVHLPPKKQKPKIVEAKALWN